MTQGQGQGQGQGKGFGFGLGKMKELREAFAKAQQVQQGAEKLQRELEEMNIEGQDSQGLVKVLMSGNQEPRTVQISEEAIAQGAEKLSESVTEAVKDAYTKSTETMRSRMDELTQGLQLPGM